MRSRKLQSPLWFLKIVSLVWRKFRKKLIIFRITVRIVVFHIQALPPPSPLPSSISRCLLRTIFWTCRCYLFMQLYIGLSIKMMRKGTFLHLLLSLEWCSIKNLNLFVQWEKVNLTMQLHTGAEHFGNVIFQYSQLTSKYHIDAWIDVNRTWRGRDKTIVSQSRTVT